MTTEVRHLPALMTDDVILELDTSLPVSADEAGKILPLLQAAIKSAERYEGFLIDTLSAAMTTQGQTERLIDGTLWKLKPEAVWQVTDEASLSAILEGAVARGEITEVELMHAMEREVVVRWNHTGLNVIAKRVPVVEKYRTQIESAPKLRQKK